MRKSGGEIDFSLGPEGGNRFASGRIEGNEPPTRVEKNAPLLAAVPDRHSPMHESHAVRWLARGIRLRIGTPEFPAADGVERDDLVVGGGEVEGIAQHQRRGFE